MGLELGLEWNLTSSLSANLVASVGKFRYASDPLISINFDTAGPEEDLINTEGYTDLGPSMVKGLHMSTGPQHAFSVGLEYRDPDYWRLGISANYLNERYIQPSFLTRTGSFRLNPDTGQAFPGATKSSVAKLLIQESLPPLYLLNMTAGKSWLSRGAYIGLFASINNLFDTSFVTGGFEQSRNGNYGQWIRDHQSGLPSFGPKYWYGQGRTFFLNLSISF
jgi:outer membrane receptor for Fe3+-dicitrate